MARSIINRKHMQTYLQVHYISNNPGNEDLFNRGMEDLEFSLAVVFFWKDMPGMFVQTEV